MDERARYFRKLRKLRRSARRWSVFAGTFAGATAVLVPYGGLGWPDAVWAALSGGTVALTFWRWHDLRELAAQPAPPALPTGPALVKTRFEALVARLPAGRNALAELRRMEARSRIRGSSVLPAWTRLDRAVQTLAGLRPADSVVLDAVTAERTLRAIGERTAAVERALALPGADDSLRNAHGELLGHFTEGVEAYEGLVAAAAGYLAHRRYRRARSAGHARRGARRVRAEDRGLGGLRRGTGRRRHRPYRLRPAGRAATPQCPATGRAVAAGGRVLPPLPGRLPRAVTSALCAPGHRAASGSYRRRRINRRDPPTRARRSRRT